MKTTTIFAAAALLFSAVTFVSCDKDGDTTKPVISLVEGSKLAGDEIAYELSGTICIEMNLSDDTSLESFKINIHNAFDGHDHVAVATTKHDDNEDWNNDTDNAFSFTATSKDAEYSDEYNISGQKNAFVDFDIDITEDAAYGDYHLLIYCYDSEGNESYITRSIQITEDGNYYDDGDDHDDE